MRDPRETIIVYSDDSHLAEVCSQQPKTWRQCVAAGAREIKLEEGFREGKKHTRWFLVPTKLVSIRKPRQLTAKQKELAQRQGLALAQAQRLSRTKQELGSNDQERAL